MFELKRGATTAHSFGLEMSLVSPKEAFDLCPILSLDGIIGAAYMPTDGQADRAGIDRFGASAPGETVMEKFGSF